jgi:hypothetical protein
MSESIRWFTDGERRYGKELWKLASVDLRSSELPSLLSVSESVERRIGSSHESKRFSGQTT